MPSYANSLLVRRIVDRLKWFTLVSAKQNHCVTTPLSSVDRTNTPCSVDLTNTPCSVDLTNTPCSVDLTNTPCSVDLTNTPFSVNLTNTHCSVDLTNTHCSVDLNKYALFSRPYKYALFSRPYKYALLSRTQTLLIFFLFLLCTYWSMSSSGVFFTNPQTQSKMLFSRALKYYKLYSRILR
jgi:hypothetical protein